MCIKLFDQLNSSYCNLVHKGRTSTQKSDTRVILHKGRGPSPEFFEDLNTCTNLQTAEGAAFHSDRDIY